MFPVTTYCQCQLGCFATRLCSEQYWAGRLMKEVRRNSDWERQEHFLRQCIEDREKTLRIFSR